MAEYWADPVLAKNDYFTLEARARIALHLLDHFGAVAGQEDGEDSAGRRQFKLQVPKDLVKRCLDIADAFVEVAESRNAIREMPTLLEVVKTEKEIFGFTYPPSSLR